jgi:hypothetical protein
MTLLLSLLFACTSVGGVQRALPQAVGLAVEDSGEVMEETADTGEPCLGTREWVGDEYSFWLDQSGWAWFNEVAGDSPVTSFECQGRTRGATWWLASDTARLDIVETLPTNAPHLYPVMAMEYQGIFDGSCVIQWCSGEAGFSVYWVG